MALFAQEAVPNKEPVNPFSEETDPVKVVEPLINREPVRLTVVPLKLKIEEPSNTPALLYWIEL